MVVVLKIDVDDKKLQENLKDISKKRSIIIKGFNSILPKPSINKKSINISNPTDLLINKLTENILPNNPIQQKMIGIIEKQFSKKSGSIAEVDVSEKQSEELTKLIQNNELSNKEILKNPIFKTIKSSLKNIKTEVNIISDNKNIQTLIDLRGVNSDKDLKIGIPVKIIDKDNPNKINYKIPIFMTEQLEKNIILQVQKNIEELSNRTIKYIEKLPDLQFLALDKVNKEISSSIKTSESPLAKIDMIRNFIKEKKDSINPQQYFISKISLMQMVKDRVHSNMRKFGIARPPIMTYRTGKFVKSIGINKLNYKTSIIEYFYANHYDRNMLYGYEVEKLVETSIRQVVSSLFKKQFQLIRAS